MESSIARLSKKHFLCSLCEDIFKTPVTTPCGHSFCKVCLRKYWSGAGSGKCPLCCKTFVSKPHLSVNHILADVTEHYRKSHMERKAKSLNVDVLLTEPEQKSDTEVEQMITQRIQKVEKLKHSLKILKSSCLREVQESHRVFSALLSLTEKAHKAVVAQVEEKQMETEKQVDQLIKELEGEIAELKTGLNIQENSGEGKEHLRKSCIHLPREMRDWTNVRVETELCVGFTRKAVNDLMDAVRIEADKLSMTELKRLQKYTVDIHLNHRTAHACLSVSDTKKQVRHTNKQQEVPENPKRFDRVTNVLSKEAFISGRHYWEVKVSEKTDWDVGLAKQSVNRKGKFAISPVNGFWMLSLKNGNQYTANTLPQTNLTLNVRPKTLAIYLDYEEGQLSFFCLESGTHIYTFTDSFTDKLHPIFNPGRPHGTKNTEPLIISSSCCTI